MAYLFISIYLLNGSLCSLIHLTTSTIVEKILLTMLANRAFSALFSSVNFLCFSSRDSVSSLLVLRLEVMVVFSKAVYYDRSWAQQLKHSEEKSTTLSQDFHWSSKYFYPNPLPSVWLRANQQTERFHRSPTLTTYITPPVSASFHMILLTINK